MFHSLSRIASALARLAHAADDWVSLEYQRDGMIRPTSADPTPDPSTPGLLTATDQSSYQEQQQELRRMGLRPPEM